MKTPLLFLAATILTAVLFTALPGIDLWVTHWFWSPDAGFFLAGWAPFRLAYHAVPAVTFGIVTILLLALGYVILFERSLGGITRPVLLYLLLSIAIGPGLLTNTLLKDHWGRARPSQVAEFGGSKAFTPALLPADQCDHNCSFVSGHAAMAFALIGFGFLPANRRRKRWLIGIAIGFGSFVGLARIAQGGHFLSDTIFAGLLVTATCWLLHRWIIVADGLSQPWVSACGRGALHLAALIRRLIDGAVRTEIRRLALRHFGFGLAFLVSVLWIDRPLARLLHVDDRLTVWFTWITQFGLGWGWLVASGGLTLALLVLARAPRFQPMRERFIAWAILPGFVFSAVAFSGLVADILKILIGRTRPKLLFAEDLFTWGGPAWRGDHWSLPSGHTVNATALALALGQIWPRHASAFFIFALLIAMSRVVTTQHYLSDTIAAIWLAWLCTGYVTGVFERSDLNLSDAKAGINAPRPARSLAYRLFPTRPRTP